MSLVMNVKAPPSSEERLKESRSWLGEFWAASDTFWAGVEREQAAEASDDRSAADLCAELLAAATPHPQPR
jgi:hypothetical protein